MKSALIWLWLLTSCSAAHLVARREENNIANFDASDIKPGKVIESHRKPSIKRTRKSSDSPETDIIGGEDAALGAFPWAVYVEFNIEGSPFICTGVLIDPEYVATAAHCVGEDVGGALSLYDSHSFLIGAVDRSNWQSESATFNGLSYTPQIVLPAKPLADNLFFWTYLGDVIDLAIVRLATRVNLPYLNIASSVQASISTVIGWGRIDNDGTLPSILQFLDDVPLLDDSECSVYSGYVPEFRRCAGSDSGFGICNGDSGGPLMVENSATSTGYELIGISEAVSSLGCGLGLPDIYADPVAFKSFIEDAICGGTCPEWTPPQSPGPTSEPTPEPTAEPTPEPTPMPEPTPEPTPQPMPQPTPKPTSTPEPQPLPDPTPAPTPAAMPEPTPEPDTEPTSTPHAQPIPEPTPEPDTKPTSTPHAQPTPEPDTEPTSTPHAQPIPEPTPEPDTKPTSTPHAQPTPAPMPRPKPTSTPHSMPTVRPPPTPKLLPCNDGVLNDGETDVDCGGPTDCPRCEVGEMCNNNGDCESNKCRKGKCTSKKGIKNDPILVAEDGSRVTFYLPVGIWTNVISGPNFDMLIRVYSKPGQTVPQFIDGVALESVTTGERVFEAVYPGVQVELGGVGKNASEIQYLFVTLDGARIKDTDKVYRSKTSGITVKTTKLPREDRQGIFNDRIHVKTADFSFNVEDNHNHQWDFDPYAAEKLWHTNVMFTNTPEPRNLTGPIAELMFPHVYPHPSAKALAMTSEENAGTPASPL